MKRLFGPTAMTVAALLASWFVAAGSARADVIAIDRDAANYSGSHGAEFRVITFTGTGVPAMGSGVQVSGGVFQTFCLEADTSIGQNTEYTYTLGTSATSGGVSGGNPDPLDDRTAYLYTQFWNGTLSNYTYTQGSGRVASADSLQLAIWYLEGELVGTLVDDYNADSQAQTWVSQANTAVASGGSWFGVGLGNVRVINPVTSGGADVQSVLVLVPLPPAALMGLGLLLGVGGACLVRRRRETLI
jgi:hypothetical protein